MIVAEAVPALVVALPLPPDLAAVAARFPWAKPLVRDAIFLLPRHTQDRLAERGKPRTILHCLNTPLCGYPLAFFYRTHPPYFLHPAEVDLRRYGLDVTSWCPACNTPRTYTER